MGPGLSEAKAAGLMVGTLFNVDFSERSLEVSDRIMAVAGLLREDSSTAKTIMRTSFPPEHLDRIERLLQVASADDSKCLSLCGGYAGEVACRNLGGQWSEQGGTAGVAFGSRFVPIMDLCTKAQYLKLKASLGRGSSAPSVSKAGPTKSAPAPARGGGGGIVGFLILAAIAGAVWYFFFR
jgi:hypothetical protein